VLGTSNRPLKSLTDMIKGKQGRFRENLLGKRVDYSGRSVIVVGPSLKLHQCGLPKKIALELFQPFIIRRLKELGYVDTIKSAKKMLERKDEEVWDILDEVIHEHPVLLNRAPTLHRMGIQAFEPVLVEGNAIHIHPLVCEAFNADFDGDQMAVHLPLSIEAQTEATILMLSTNNIFSPADGNPIIGPSLDMVLGCHYLTMMIPQQADGHPPAYGSKEEVIMAYEEKSISLHQPIAMRLPQGTEIVEDRNRRRIEAENGEESRMITTAGRVIFNDAMPGSAFGDAETKLPYFNIAFDKKGMGKVISECHEILGRSSTIELLDVMKNLGFTWATRAGISIATSDLRTPARKQEILDRTQAEVDRIERNYRRGVITQTERYLQIIEHWTHAANMVTEELMAELKSDVRDGKDVNPLWLMFASGARGSTTQIRQLAGMRGLMTKPSGKIIETPIKANFREGLPVVEYFSSAHGGRKGLADTALKTAESGYLTRKLADVAQNVVISEHDCRTVNGITKTEVRKGETIEVPLSQLIRGRTSQETVVDKLNGVVIVKEGEVITFEQARQIEALNYTSLRVRSPMTCESPKGVCAKCYGVDLSTGDLVEEGMAVGIIAAQSIGEPGTQLTMRTFHIGGTAQRVLEEAEIRSPVKGTVQFANVQTVQIQDGKQIVLNQQGEVVISEKDKETVRRYQLRAGAVLHVREGDSIKPKDLIAKWDPHVTPIVSEKSGIVRFEDIVEEETMRQEVDTGGSIRKVIVEHKGDLHPQIIIVGKDGEPLAIYSIPEKAILDVDEGEEIAAGTQLARTPREIGRSEDITAGLPRVTELFEARKPKDPAIISEISGIVELGERKRGKRTIVVRNETGLEREHLVPHGKHLTVNKGDRVREGDRLVDGPLIPQDILRISGEEALQQYIVREIQSVYRTQHEAIDDKHIEVIVSQMMRKVRVSDDTGDTEFLPGTVVDKFIFRAENERVVQQGGKPASATPLLFGVTKAALQSESFISAASFQETTKVLTEAALAGKTDYLVGLKENVILGHMIPAGTGFAKYRLAELKREALPAESPEQKAAPMIE